MLANFQLLGGLGLIKSGFRNDIVGSVSYGFSIPGKAL